MMLKQLLSILVCPSCKAELEYHPQQSELWCRAESIAFSIKDEIPVMLIDQARKLTAEELQIK